MSRKISDAAVTKFLRDTLASEALGVTKLDGIARARGLLGERQHITHARVFRRAKRSLGIRSIRNGFGAGARWAWALPRSSEGKASSSSQIKPQSTRDGLV